MTTPFESQPLRFIQKVNSSLKIRRSITLEDIVQVLKHQRDLNRISDRGLFILLLTELIKDQFALFLVRMKTLHHEICPPLRVPRKKKEDGEDNPPRRARKPRVNIQGVDLNQIASDSVSNPSHLQDKQRLVREEGVRDDSRGSNPSKGSNPSNDPNIGRNIDLNAEMEKIGGENLDMGDMGMAMEEHFDSMDNSSGSDSTRMSSNAIPKLSQKLRILGGDVSFQGKRTVARKRREHGGSATVKRKEGVVDLSTNLDETKLLMDPRQIPDTVLKEKCRAMDYKRSEEQAFKLVGAKANQIMNRVLEPSLLRRLKDFQRVKKGTMEERPDYGEQFFDIDTGGELFNQQFSAPSTQISAAQEESAFNHLVQDHLDSSLFSGQTSMTLSDLRERTNRPKSQLFIKLLWMSHRGEVRMSQPNPERFGEITVSLMTV